MDFQNLVKEKNRHGTTVYYHRVGKGPRTRIRAEFGTPEFERAYRLAEQGKTADENANPRVLPARAGTLRDLIVSYYRSPEFRKELDPSTQHVRRLILDKLCLAGKDAAAGKPCYGDRPVALMATRHVRKIRDGMSDRPEAANNMLKALRRVFSYGLEIEYPGLKFNPARDVKRFKSKGTGYHTWTIEEVEQYERRHPVGTKARLALALMLYTGQRRSDAVKFGPPLVRSIPSGELKGEWLDFTQVKNQNRNPVSLWVPIIPELRRIINATDVVGAKTWLVTDYGEPFTANGFGNWFRERCIEAGVPGRAHGLRKALSSRAAELDCTDRQIMSITGHVTPQEIDRYTKAARQRILAAKAMEKIRGMVTEHAKAEIPHLPESFPAPAARD